MPSIPLERRSSWRAAACALALVIVILAAMQILSGADIAANPFNSYQLQAQAWLRGEVCLDRDYPHLELAIYEGKYFVSFPPVPSIPMLAYTLIFGDSIPAALIQKCYVAIACLVVLSELARSRRMSMGDCTAWSILLCLGSALLPVTLVAGVWYEAQILAFLFSVSAIAAMRRKHPTLSCFLYALSVGCRPFTVLLGPVLLMLHLENARASKLSRTRTWCSLIPGVCLGLAVAACYGAYNYVRFGNPFEFGHNYLPEFTREEHGQFSLVYVANNFRTLFFGKPFRVDGPSIRFEEFGFSMFLSCPILLCNLIWILLDLARRRMTPAKLVILAMGAVNIFCLLLHRTLGGHQFGARYAIELIPLCFAYLLLSPDKRRLTRWESVLMCFGLAFNFLGGCLVHI